MWHSFIAMVPSTHRVGKNRQSTTSSVRVGPKAWFLDVPMWLGLQNYSLKWWLANPSDGSLTNFSWRLVLEIEKLISWWFLYFLAPKKTPLEKGPENLESRKRAKGGNVLPLFSRCSTGFASAKNPTVAGLFWRNREVLQAPWGWENCLSFWRTRWNRRYQRFFGRSGGGFWGFWGFLWCDENSIFLHKWENSSLTFWQSWGHSRIFVVRESLIMDITNDDLHLRKCDCYKEITQWC